MYCYQGCTVKLSGDGYSSVAHRKDESTLGTVGNFTFLIAVVIDFRTTMKSALHQLQCEAPESM